MTAAVCILLALLFCAGIVIVLLRLGYDDQVKRAADLDAALAKLHADNDPRVYDRLVRQRGAST